MTPVSAMSDHTTTDPLFHELYAAAIQQPDASALGEQLTHGLARLYQLPLVLLGRYQPHGTISVVASSRETRLWADLQRIPERWDGSVVGRGLAAMALASSDPVQLELGDERFICWQEAAADEHLRYGWAIAIETPQGHMLIEMFTPSVAGLGEILRALRAPLQRFFASLHALQQQHLLASALEQAGNPGFITDREGMIVWCNHAFSRMYGYSREDAIGLNPRVLKSGRQGLRYYRELWSTIRSGQVWSGETIDSDREGRTYTVRQTITPFATGDHLSHYLSVHDDISQEQALHRHRDLRNCVDPISGLLTRTAFEARLSDPTAEQTHPWDLVLISMAEFHHGVASLGYELADRVGAEIGARIRALLSPVDIGGVVAAGEYALQLPREHPHRTDELIARLRKSLAEPLEPLGSQLTPHARFAVARCPEDGKDYPSLMHHADRQLADTPLPRAHR